MRLLTPSELREATERDYRASFKAAGYTCTDDDIRKIAMADLLLVDAARSAGDLASQRAARPAEKPIAKPRMAEKAYATTGMRKADGRTLKFRSLDANPQQLGARWGAACARLHRIMEGAGRSATLAGAVANSTVPKLAREWMDAYGFFMTRGGPPPSRGRIDPNPFRGLSDRDASRLLIRMGEDICDRSTGVLNAWYVK